MNTLSIEGWSKAGPDAKSTPLGIIQFHVKESDHLRLEQAEEELGKTHVAELMVDVDMSEMGLVMPDECGPLSDCQFRVYVSEDYPRGQFHLVGHRASDGNLVYSNAVMIDQLG